MNDKLTTIVILFLIVGVIWGFVTRRMEWWDRTYQEDRERTKHDILLTREFMSPPIVASEPRTTCRYCARVQRRPKDGRCEGCGADLPFERERLDVSTFDSSNKWIDGQEIK